MKIKFDIKNVKSWANRHDVKVGDSGYVSSNLHSLQDELKNGAALVSEISHICDDDVYCFSCKAFGDIRSYGFFLPAEAVIEDLKEKSYRPFKTLDEFYDFTGAHSYLREIYIVFRNKKTHRVYDESIFSISYNEKDELLTINRFSVQELFDNFEFYSFGKWVPFGVEIEDEQEK